MAKKIMKTCIVCGKEYEYCNGCSSYNNMEAWHSIYHDENCRKIFNTAANYHAGLISKEEAIEEFRKCDLTDKSNFKSSIRVLIDELLSAEIVNEQPIDVENSTSTENKENPQKKRGQRAKMKMVDETALNGDL